MNEGIITEFPVTARATMVMIVLWKMMSVGGWGLCVGVRVWNSVVYTNVNTAGIPDLQLAWV